jgi:hypothetical protein
MVYVYIKHHHLKAMTHIKYSLKFAKRHLCAADGDPQRLRTPDERRLSVPV